MQQHNAECTEIARILNPVFSVVPEVVSAFLFGSLATGDGTSGSDIDIAVYVTDPKAFSFSDKLTLHGDCCRALRRNDVDLVVMNQMRNLLLLEHILREGRVIYSTDSAELDYFMVTKLHQAIDFRLHRRRAMGA